MRTTLENRAWTKPICRNAFLQLLPHVFSRCASSTTIAHSRAANSPPSFARSLKPGEINCSGAMKRRLGPVSAVFHKFSPRFRASRIVSELITNPFSPNFSMTLACRECLQSLTCHQIRYTNHLMFQILCGTDSHEAWVFWEFCSGTQG